MISKETSQEVLGTLKRWAQDEMVEWVSVQRLVHMLNSCDGNRSYKDTMRNLELLVREAK